MILLLAAGVTISAVLLGLSEKPDVTAIGVSVADAGTVAPLATAPATAAGPADSTAVAGAAATTIELDESGQNALIVGRVVHVHVDDDAWDADAQSVDPDRLRPLARMGTGYYARLGELIELPRPTGLPKK